MLILSPVRCSIGIRFTPVHDGTLSMLVCSADTAMQDVFGAEYVSLHVRVTNRAAKHLYTQSLGYRCAGRPRANPPPCRARGTAIESPGRALQALEWQLGLHCLSLKPVCPKS